MTLPTILKRLAELHEKATAAPMDFDAETATLCVHSGSVPIARVYTGEDYPCLDEEAHLPVEEEAIATGELLTYLRNHTPLWLALLELAEKARAFDHRDNMMTDAEVLELRAAIDAVDRLAADAKEGE